MRLMRILILGICLTALGSQAYSQCNDKLLDIALQAIGQGEGKDYTYLKDFKVRLKKAKKNTEAAKYTVILSKGTVYRFTTTNASEYEGELVWHLSDENGLVMSNLVRESGKVYGMVDLTCKKSGRYYLTYTFKDGKEGCGVGVLAFKNKSRSIDELLDY